MTHQRRFPNILSNILCVVGLVFIGQAAYCKPYEQHSLQRGAVLFMNYCSGCHSLQYMRYNQIAKDLVLLNKEGQINTAVLKSNLMMMQTTLLDPVRIALSKTDAQQWFGAVPPDLSLMARQRGTRWIFEYLQGFYLDDNRPFRTNNRIVPFVAMPDVLAPLRSQVQSGSLSVQQFDKDLVDLVKFLDYVSDPKRALRIHLGIFVVSFLAVFSIVVWQLTRAKSRRACSIKMHNES